MKSPNVLQSVRTRGLSRPVLFGGLALLVLVLAGLLYSSRGKGDNQLSFYEVRRGDFLISVVEGGTIEAVNDVVVRSEFEGTARIIFLVKEGTYVKKGDLLVELDSSQAQDQVNQQQINHEKNQFAVTQAEQQLTIQRSIVDGEILNAELKVKFAQIELDKFLKGSREQARRNAEIEITNVVENLKIAEDRLEWTRKLFAAGWETKSKLDQDELSVSQLRLKMEQAERAFWMLKEFDEKKSLETLQADVKESTENLARVKLQGERRLAQYQADLETQKSTLELSAKKLERDRKQLEACTIKAPQDGLVVYAGMGGGGGRGFSSESMVEEGATVRNRQELIKLPDVSEMKLELKIHEAHINSIRPGQQAFVVLDSMPDKRFQGLVSRVGLVPDSASRWGNPNLKLYATQIVVTDPLPNVKPGVSARAEIVITNLADVVTVPIQAVTTRQGRQVVFVPGDPPKAVPVTVGMYNTKFIEIASGLEPGDRVLLSPPLDTDEKDLGGAILAKGEALPPKSTNGIPGKSLPIQPDASARPGPAVGMTGPGGLEGAANPASGAFGGGRGNGGPGRQGGPRAMPEEVLKQYDKNGDGELDATERETMMAAMRERFGATGGGPGGGQGGPRLSPEEMLKQFDKNGDGELDETEREAMRAARGARSGGQGGRQGGGPRLSPEEMLKQYDKNSDGEIDETEREAMRAAMRARSGGGPGGEGGRSGGDGSPRGAGGGSRTNAPAEAQPRP